MDDIAETIAAVIVRHAATTDANGWPACLQEDWESETTTGRWNWISEDEHAQHVAQIIVMVLGSPQAVANQSARRQTLRDAAGLVMSPTCPIEDSEAVQQWCRDLLLDEADD